MQAVDRDQLAPMIRARASASARLLVAVAGAPGAGKSTLAEALRDELGPDAQVVPMDGFHLDNDTLRARGLFERKGAPETFDAAGFADLVRRIKAGGEVSYPTFDRSGDCTVPDGGAVRADTKIVLAEGNYLLMDADGWRDLAPLWDLKVWIDEPLALLENRLIQRWLDHGLTREAAETRARGNDIRNARTVIAATPGATENPETSRVLVG